jgi:sulfur-oxidizing protein SoxY
MMFEDRRTVVKAGMLFAALAFAARPLKALALDWKKAAFNSKAAADAIQAIGAASARPSAEIGIRVPEIAENGGVVPIEVSSRIPGTRSLAIVADRNPFPLLAIFNFADQAYKYASTRIKLAETSPLRAFAATSDGTVYVASTSITVTVGGCGG